MTVREAGNYLNRYKGLDFLVCYNNGGGMR